MRSLILAATAAALITAAPLAADRGAHGLALPASFSGMLVYFADAAVFTECLTGQTFPVMMEDDYLALERAYLKGAPSPAAPLLVRVEGTITEREQMEGPPRRSLVVSRFHHVTPDAGCASARATPELTNTYWRITHLDGMPVNPLTGRTEPHLLFLDGDRSRVSGTIGCNIFRGGFERTGPILQFSQFATTRMACPPGVDFLEAAFGRALGYTQAFEIVGQILRLMGADGRETVRLQAVYTPF
jgi:copper homeostasis protein (lipoprotein)